MSDIQKMMDNPETDPKVLDHLADMAGWDEGTGKELAAKEGITLTDEHWEVINFLRDYYKEHGRARSGRELSEILDEKFEAQGGRKHLYRLFPQGPVAQGSRIAGLPLPQYAQDGSFGYSQ